jgi:hypothetical protein
VTSDEIPVPRGIAKNATVIATYTVTDVGIAAGETFGGTIDDCWFGEDVKKLFQAKRNELVVLIDYLVKGISTGWYEDDMPTTATAENGRYIVPGPFNTFQFDNPVFHLELLAATSEWAAASAYTATIQLEVDMYPVNNSVVCLEAKRFYRASGSDHYVRDINDKIFKTCFYGATDDYVDVVEYTVNGKSYYENTDRKALQSEYAGWKTSAYDLNRYQLDIGPVPPSSDRELHVNQGTADTLTGWFLKMDIPTGGGLIF